MSETEIYQVKRLAESAPAQVYPYIKRLIDLAICALALIWLLPIMGLIALAIVLDSPGSFLFVQTRIGKDGRPFRIYKFRTMSSNYDSSEDRKYMAAFVAGIAGRTKTERARRPSNRPWTHTSARRSLPAQIQPG